MSTDTPTYIYKFMESIESHSFDDKIWHDKYDDVFNFNF